jgi:alpha-galactosidase
VAALVVGTAAAAASAEPAPSLGSLLHTNPGEAVIVGKDVAPPQGRVPDNEYQFHATLIHATGGMLLSGDDLTRITPRRAAMLKHLVPPTGGCARFEDDRFEVGVTTLRGRVYYSVFNWGDAPVRRVVSLARPVHLRNVWTGEDLGEHSGEYRIETLPPRSALLLEGLPSR